TNTFDGIVGDCDAIRFCISDYPANTIFIIVRDADTDEVIAGNFVSGAPYCYTVNTCVRQFRISGSNFTSETFNIVTPGAPPFILTPNPSIAFISPSQGDFAAQTNISSTRCIQPGDFSIDNITSSGPIFNISVTSTITYTSFGPNINLFVTSNASGGVQTYLINFSATSAFCGDVATGSFLVVVFPFRPAPEQVAVISQELLPEDLDAAGHQDYFNSLSEGEMQDLVDQSASMIESIFGADNLTVSTQPVAYPNPSLGQITLSYGHLVPQTVRLIDMNGRELQSYQAIQIPDEQMNIDMSSFPNGMYFLETISESGERHVERIQLNQ
ncbi:MAG: T9SS type A sorting domain-containing protein, partial [Bacteroidota bacterium]